MDQDYIFTIIGKLYIDITNAQKIIEGLQMKLKEKDKIIQDYQHKESLGHAEG